MLVIRLTRVGKKNSPSFRIVVADKKKAVKRKFIEIIGNYNPSSNPKQLVVDKERALYWIGQGAQPSETVNNLLVRMDVLAKDKMVNVVYGKPTKKKDAGKEPEQPATQAEEVAESAQEVEASGSEAESPEETPTEAPEAKEEAPAETE